MTLKANALGGDPGRLRLGLLGAGVAAGLWLAGQWAWTANLARVDYLKLAHAAGAGRPAPAAQLLAVEARLEPAALAQPAPGVFATLARLSRLRGDDSAALANWDAALALAPNDRVALLERGLVKADLGQEADALADWRRIGPAAARRFVNLGLQKYDQGRSAEALVSYRRAAAIDPADPEPWYWMAGVHWANGDFAAAREALQVYLAFSPPASSRRSLSEGRLLALDRQWRPALQAFRAASQFEPNLVMAHLFAGEVLLELDQPAAAAAEFEQELRLGTPSERIYQDLVTAYRRAGNVSAAEFWRAVAQQQGWELSP